MNSRRRKKRDAEKRWKLNSLVESGFFQVMSTAGSGNNDPIVVLDVGGTFFKTRTSTLLRAPYFSALLAERYANANESAQREAIFLDRSPTLFEEVLRLLRNPNYETKVDGAKSEYAHFGIALEELRRYLSIPPDRIRTIGDSTSPERAARIGAQHVQLGPKLVPKFSGVAMIASAPKNGERECLLYVRGMPSLEWILSADVSNQDLQLLVRSLFRAPYRQFEKDGSLYAYDERKVLHLSFARWCALTKCRWNPEAFVIPLRGVKKELVIPDAVHFRERILRGTYGTEDS